ncbi:MAG: hypothetical protein HY791_37635 [Deltaproteobacteria bacterium]|nr:hypothetical protein [Deltaproteobacteria bacterium]
MRPRLDRSARRAAVVSWIALTACFTPIDAPGPSGNGYFLAALVDPSNDEVAHAEIRRTLPSSLMSPELELVAWWISGETHEFPREVETGEPTAVSDREDPPEGSCGRCLVPRLSPPRTFHSGDLCPPSADDPAFIDGAWQTSPDTARSSRLRSKIRVAWPGKCRYPSVALHPAAEREYEVIHPDPEEEPGFYLPSQDGSILSITLGSVSKHAIEGVTRVPRSIGFPVSGIGLPDGSFVVAVADADPMSVEWRPVLLSSELLPRTVTSFPQIRLSSLEIIPGTRSEFLVLGFDPSTRDGSSYTCNVGTGQLDCELSFPPREFKFGTQINAVTSVGDRYLLWAADRKEGGPGLPIALIDRDTGEYGQGVIPGSILADFPDAEAHAVGALGSRVFVVASTGSRVYIFTRRFEPTDFEGLSRADRDAEISRDWEVATELETLAKCTSRALFDGKLYLTCSEGMAFEIDPDGSRRWVDAATVTGVPGRVTRFESKGEWSFVSTRSGALYRKRGLEPATRVLGPDPEFGHTIGAIIPRDGGFVAFASGLEAAVEIETSSVSRRRRTDFLGQPVAGGVDPHSGAVWVATSSSAGTGLLYELDDDSFRPTPIPERPFIGALTFPVPGTILAITSSGLTAIEDGSATQLALDWDDPATEDLEVPPGPCEHLFEGPALKRERMGPFRSLDSAGGVSWAVGCDLVIFRVTRGAEGWEAQRLAAPLRELAEIWPDRGFSVVRALAPDELLLGAHARNDGLREQGALWRARLSADGTRLETQLLEGPAHPPPSPRLGVNGGPPISVVGPLETAQVLQRGEWFAVFKGLGSTRATVYFRSCLTGAFNEDLDRGLVGCTSETLLVSRPK